MVNRYLNGLMPGLSAKVFRTYNASHTFQQELQNTPIVGTVSEKILAYNRANRQVAVLCNHQKTVSKSHSTVMDKLNGRLKAIRTERRHIKRELEARNYKNASSSSSETEFSSEEDEVKKEVKSEGEEEKNEESLHSSQEADPLKKITGYSTEKLVKKLNLLGDKISALKNSILDKVRDNGVSYDRTKTNKRPLGLRS